MPPPPAGLLLRSIRLADAPQLHELLTLPGTTWGTNQITAQTISDEICLPFYNIVDRALTVLKKEELIEVAGSNGFGELAYQYSITPKGVIRAHQILERTTYVGPAPVTVEHYRKVIHAQAISTVRVAEAPGASDATR